MRVSLHITKSCLLVGIIIPGLMTDGFVVHAQADLLATTTPEIAGELQQLDSRAEKALSAFSALEQQLQTNTPSTWGSFFSYSNIGVWILILFLLILAILLFMLRRALLRVRKRVPLQPARDPVPQRPVSTPADEPLVMPRRIVKIKVRKIKTSKNNP